MGVEIPDKLDLFGTMPLILLKDMTTNYDKYSK
jgi:hypothetical protein